MTNYFRNCWQPLVPGIKCDNENCNRSIQLPTDDLFIENYHHTVLATPELRSKSGVLLPIGSYVTPRPNGPRIPSEVISPPIHNKTVKNANGQVYRAGQIMPSDCSIVFIDHKYRRLSTDVIQPEKWCEFNGTNRLGQLKNNVIPQADPIVHKEVKRKKRRKIRVKCPG